MSFKMTMKGGCQKMDKYKITIHGTVTQQNVKSATEQFLKKIMLQKKGR